MPHAAGRLSVGHLLLGCEVFVAEITIGKMTGVELIRTPDEVSGLSLW